MIPVVACPVLNGYDLLARMLASIDEPVGELLVIDNGGRCPDITGARVLRMPGNLGVPAAWNLAIKATPQAPWWCIVNHDLAFGPGDLAALTVAMEEGAWLATLDGFAAFGISRACVEQVGYFDENFYVYCEDADYEYRCRLSGVNILALPSTLTHERSSTIAVPHYAAENARTYPEARRYHVEKWGGELRGGERFTTPFDSGADPSEWTLDHRRLRQLHWEWQPDTETTALEPEGYERR